MRTCFWTKKPKTTTVEEDVLPWLNAVPFAIGRSEVYMARFLIVGQVLPLLPTNIRKVLSFGFRVLSFELGLNL